MNIKDWFKLWLFVELIGMVVCALLYPLTLVKEIECSYFVIVGGVFLLIIIVTPLSAFFGWLFEKWFLN